MNETYGDGESVIEKIEIENVPPELGKMIMDFVYGGKKEKILPRPVIRDGNGKLIKHHTPKDFYMKLQEEIFEVMEAAAEGTDDEFDESLAEEIADVITVCISYLNALGYDEEKCSEIFRRVNEKNEKRGYFKESD